MRINGFENGTAHVDDLIIKYSLTTQQLAYLSQPPAPEQDSIPSRATV